MLASVPSILLFVTPKSLQRYPFTLARLSLSYARPGAEWYQPTRVKASESTRHNVTSSSYPVVRDMKDSLLASTSLDLTSASNPERPREGYKKYRTALSVT